MSYTENTQLTNASGYDVSRMLFSKPQPGNIPNSVPPISYKRINLGTVNEDGTTGELILETERVFSFGVSENKNPETDKVNGYVMSLCLWNRDGATAEEKEWTDVFDKVVEKCKDHLLENKEDLNLYELERNDLKKLNPLYFKREKGKIVDGVGPTLYAKLIQSKKANKVLTQLYNEHGDDVDAMSLLGKYCYIKGAVKIESIFIGNKVSLQVKMYEGEVRLLESGMKRLLRRPASEKNVSVGCEKANPLGDDEKDENPGAKVDVKAKKAEANSVPKPSVGISIKDDDEGSIKGDEDEEDPSKKPLLVGGKKKVVRKVVKKVVVAK